MSIEKLMLIAAIIKETRAMANSLYSTGSFIINDAEGTLNQLEGRFSFIDQAENYNNINDGKAPLSPNPSTRKEVHHFKSLSAREEQYRKFLVFKHFLANDKPDTKQRDSR